jgi:hypothetical protein
VTSDWDSPMCIYLRVGSGAVGNVVANAFGVLVPWMGVLLRQRTGSWLPHLLFGAALKLLAT